MQEFKRLENLAEGRSRSCTDTTVYSLINRGKSCHKSPLQPPLRRGNVNSYVASQLIDWNGYETRQTPLLYVFVDLKVRKVQ